MNWSEIMDTNEAAKALGVSPRRVKALLAAGLLDGRRFSGVWIVTRESVERRKEENPKAGRPRKVAGVEVKPCECGEMPAIVEDGNTVTVKCPKCDK